MNGTMKPIIYAAIAGFFIGAVLVCLWENRIAELQHENGKLKGELDATNAMLPMLPPPPPPEPKRITGFASA